MRSRVRLAASACLVAAGLSLAGLGGAMALADSPDDTASAADAGPEQAQPGAGNANVQGGQDDPGSDGGGEAKAAQPDDAPTATGGGRWTPVWSRLPRWLWPQPPVETSAEPSVTPTATEPTTTGPTTTEPTTTGPTTTEPTTTEPTTTDPTTLPAPRDTGDDGEVPAAFGPLLDESGQLTPAAVDVAAGLPVVVPMAPIPVPVIAVPPAVTGPGSSASGAPAVEAPDVAPRSVTAPEPALRRPEPPASVREPAAVPVNFRIGYREYLRTADVAQIAAVAVPGTAGILMLTALGGLVGYRQAKAGRAGRSASVARFMT